MWTFGQVKSQYQRAICQYQRAIGTQYQRAFNTKYHRRIALNSYSLGILKTRKLTTIPRLKPYWDLMRLDKPIGTWLLYLPCTWSILMSSYHYSLPLSNTVEMLGLFGLGSILLRGAGCTINDLWDRNLDQLVERTRNRPLASGAITPFSALVFLGGQLSLGLLILTQLNLYSIVLGASSLVLVGLYPLMKRITYWPQMILGMTFNWGALLGYSAMVGYIDPSAIALYVSGITWTLVYDTIYACQDKSDDVQVGIKSTAIRFGNDVKKWLSGFAILTVSGFAVAGYLNDQGLAYYIVGVFGSASHFFWQIKTWNPLSTIDCWSKFKSNRTIGLLIASGILIDILTK